MAMVINLFQKVYIYLQKLDFPLLSLFTGAYVTCRQQSERIHGEYHAILFMHYTNELNPEVCSYSTREYKNYVYINV